MRCLFGMGAALAAWAVAQPAEAGAWIAPEGGQEILTLTYGQREDAHVSETDYYYERPVGGRYALVVRPWVETSTTIETSWRAEALVAGKVAVLRRDSAVAAVQAGAVWRSDPEPGCGEAGGEIRALAGASRGRGFLNAEIAVQGFSGGCPRQRLEITAGYRPGAHWLVMGQAFAETDREGEPSVQAQASVVRFGHEGRGLQLGLRVRLDGTESAPTFVLGWWGAPQR